jgi:renalase
MSKKVGIIGAGISGLVCARALRAQGHEVTVLEKSRSYGGRCATRLWNGHVVDHGAQYFTVQEAAFRSELEQTAGPALVKLEKAVFNFQGEVLPCTGEGRFYLTTGNNRLGKILAEGLEVKLEQTIQKLSVEKNQVRADDFHFDALVSSVPTPQLAHLLGWKESPVRYAKCLTAFFAYEGIFPGCSAERYALSSKDADEVMSWSACENHKQQRIRGEVTVFVVQASELFSARHWDDDPTLYVPELQERLEKYWDLDGVPRRETFAHRWGFARPVEVGALPELPAGVFVCGDSVVPARIEDVWRSGVEAAERVRRFLL